MRLRYLTVLAWMLTVPASATHALTLKIATLAPDGTTWMMEMRNGAKEIAALTDKRVNLRFYPGGVMGNDKSVLRKVRIGQLHGGAVTGSGLALIYPGTMIYSLPFTFRSAAEVDYVRTHMDPLLIDNLEKAGYVTLGFVEGGFGYLMSSAPVRALDDLRGKKVWVPEGDRITRAMFEDVNVSPIPLPLPDVLTGLQTGLIDTVGGPAIGVIALQWHTRIKYLTDTPLVYLYGALLIDRRAFSKLGAKDQIIVREVMSEIAARLNRKSSEDEEKARQTLQDQGIAFVTPSREAVMELHRSVARTVDRLAAESIIPPRLLEILRTHLNEYRQSAGATP